MNKAKLLGDVGESLIAAEYRKRGYSLIAAKYKVRAGEIDLIAFKKNILAFIEVKSRSNVSFALPREYVNLQKQERIIFAAKSFLSSHSEFAKNICRFDVAEVIFDEKNDYKINIIENSFTL